MKNILLIDDNTDIRESIEEILALEGYSVHAACSGKAAFELLVKQVPDLVLCDILMSDMDGYSIFNAFKQWPHTNRIPFIFMTAMSEKRDKDKALSQGVTHYLIKPFDDLDLLTCIRECLETT